MHNAIISMTRISVPVIVAVHGNAAGAGFSLICGCDLVLSADSARFTMAYTHAGLSPDGGSTYFLPRLIGYRRALELALTNRVLTAREALEWGIVTSVVPDEELFEEAKKVAAQLATGATRALGTAKRLLHRTYSESLDSQLENESLMIAEMARTIDAREGINSFLEKCKPTFKGE